MGAEVAVLPVDGDEVAGPGQVEHQLQILLRGVAGDMDEGHVLPEHLGPQAKEGVDHPADDPLVAGDDPGGENHQVAFLDLEMLVLSGRHERDGRVGLPLASGGEDDLAIRRKFGQLLQRREHTGGNCEIPQLAGDRHVPHHALPEERHLPPVAGRQVQHVLDSVNVGGEGGHDDPPPGLLEEPGEGLPNVRLGAGVPGTLRVGGVGAEGQHSPLPQLGEPVIVGMLAVDRARVQLEVSGVDDGADRAPDGEPDAVHDRVGDAERLHGETAQLEPLARAERPEVGLLREAVLAQAIGHERQRERSAVDRDREVAEQVRKRADVILVAVGQHHSAKRLALAEKIGEIGDDVVDPQHLVIGKHEAAVHGDQILAELDQHHVEADLAEPTQRDQAH